MPTPDPAGETLPSKIVARSRARETLNGRFGSDKRVVFTNGCFDLLHVGHVRYLAAARSLGDVLVVGVNSDRSVRCIKGDKRPIVPEDQRAEVLAALACVDMVVIFDEADPLKLIQAVAPDILVKGADWPAHRIVGADAVTRAGGKVVRVPLVDGASTSHLIERIVRRYADGSAIGAG